MCPNFMTFKNMAEWNSLECIESVERYVGHHQLMAIRNVLSAVATTQTSERLAPH